MVRCKATCLVILGGDGDDTPSAVEYALRADAVGSKGVQSSGLGREKMLKVRGMDEWLQPTALTTLCLVLTPWLGGFSDGPRASLALTGENAGAVLVYGQVGR